MNKLHVKYLVVGGGVAGGTAAQAIRDNDPAGAILLVTQEAIRPYTRVPLSRQALRDRLPRQNLFLHAPGWYAHKRVELRTGRRALGLDVQRHAVMLDNAEEVSYDRLLLSTGAAPRHLAIPGAQLPGLHYLRTLDDLDRLHHAIDQAAREGHRHLRAAGAGRGRVCVIGSGLLATELAMSLTQMGLEVDLLLKRELAWPRFAGEVVGRWVMRVLENRGVAIHPDGAPVRLEGDGRVQRAVLPTMQAIQCDFAIAAVGVAANRELLRGTPIVAEKAILTDPFCRTSVPDVFAAGDCAAIFDPLFNRHRMMEHFESALNTGALAGHNMAGGERPYSGVSHFETELFDARVEVWGEARHVRRRLVRGNGGGENASFIELGLTADDRISHAISVNAAADRDVVRELVQHRTCVAEKEELVKDPTVPLAQLLG